MRYRASSLCIIRRHESILLEQFPEEDGVITFRPVGGTIEYGEDSRTTVIREVKEEINQDIVEPRLLGIVENIFPYYEQLGHEFDFIYEAKFLDAQAYEQEVIQGIEGEKPYAAVWKSLHDFKENPRYKLVPDGLYEMLADEENKCISKIQHVSTRELMNF